MNWLLAVIAIPALTGLVCFLFGGRTRIVAGGLAVLGSLASIGAAGWIWMHYPMEWVHFGTCWLRADALNGFILLAAALFGLLISVYSLAFMRRHPETNGYYGYLLLTLASTFCVLLSNHWILLLVSWGLLGALLYLLVLLGGRPSAQAAKKTLILVGGSDMFLLLGIAILSGVRSPYEILPMEAVVLDGFWIHIAFFSLVAASFAKAGAMPLHTWIPDVAEVAPIPVTAYLPAALDKLLGIYLLARICTEIFVLTGPVRLILMAFGVVTIIAAVMMALVQHDFRRLLAYHAVSQVGYMILGIANGNPIGLAGGLFHMLNHAIYKAGLFLTGGAVQHRTGQTDLDHLGGLAKYMPLTFLCFLTCAFSISGIPPFNGFASKWMIYQGLIEAGRGGDAFWPVWLFAALFGSALTLASFMKLAHAIFLGIPSREIERTPPKEVGPAMLLPGIALAVLCIVFGVFAFQIPVRHFLVPITGVLPTLGLWSPGIATLLVFAGLAAGGLIYVWGRIGTVRRSEPFIGGESLPVENRVTGVRFYQTVAGLAGLRCVYGWAENKAFDVYEQGTRFVLWASGLLRRTHSGVVTQYLAWVLVGTVVLLTVWLGR